VTFTLGVLYTRYNFLNQSESYLGNSQSPVSVYMNAWELLFCLLLVIFAMAVKKSRFNKGKWIAAFIWLIIVYGVGEGAGSGLFPYDFVGDELTLSGYLHSFFSGIGIAALIIIPLVSLKIFPKTAFPIMYFYSLIVFITGLLFVLLFLISKQMIIPYKGLWQRIFLFQYHLYLIIFAIVVYRTHQIFKEKESL